MKLTAVLLAIPLALGTGSAFADSTTTTESQTTNPMTGTSERSSSMERHDSDSNKSIERRDSMRENSDGSVETESSKTVTKPD